MDVQCPKCGVANAPQRKTCVACHAILPENLPQMEEPVKVTIPKHVSKKAPPSPPKHAPKRRPPRNKTAETTNRMFILDNNKLVIVTVFTSVKKAKPTEAEKVIISLWNRIKKLLK